jgi:hypothetical protein
MSFTGDDVAPLKKTAKFRRQRFLSATIKSKVFATEVKYADGQSCNQVTKAKSQASLKSQGPSLKSSRKSKGPSLKSSLKSLVPSRKSSLKSQSQISSH